MPGRYTLEQFDADRAARKEREAKEEHERRERCPNYDTLKIRLEVAHSAVEAAAVEAKRRLRLNEGR